jgi:hypothetical protein
MHWKMCKIRNEKSEIINKMNECLKDIKDLITDDADYKSFITSKIQDVENKTIVLNNQYEDDDYKRIIDILKQYYQYDSYKNNKNKSIKTIKEKLLKRLANAVEYNGVSKKNKKIRKLSEVAIVDNNVVSVFESTLTRTLDLKINEISTDIIIVKVYYFDVIKDLIINGFEYNGELYRFFTASAGQIRTKKTVFIKQSLWDEYQKTLMCGLTIESINKKGGVNVNKFLAYLALSNSATDEWKEFDIDRCIVVDDFETMIESMVEYIDDKTYKLKRLLKKVNVTHTDGCCMVLPSLMDKNGMIRLPWIKGLMAVWDYILFIEEANKIDPSVNHAIIKDIYGKEHDVIKENIQIIFTKSQFKMYKYYDSWDDYVKKYKENHCQAGLCNVEENYIPNAKINYQMLQTLNKMTDDELLDISKASQLKLNNIATTLKSMLDVFGVTKYNKNKTSLQKALEIYPELLNDIYTKEVLRSIKKSLVEGYKSAKLELRCKYTFIIPDMYAFCEKLFLGKENPDGLLQDGEVSCRLYKTINKLDCLRSPHLSREHSVRKNIINENTEKWFKTDALYTSCHDLISKVLQFDVDGDKSLVVAEKTLVEVAERHMKGVVPLYYEMKKASPVLLSNEEFYNGLNAAYTGGNIGAISNDITKIWNSGRVKKHELKAIKYLCMENNFTIDYAKTLYKPIRPKKVNELIKKYTKSKVPHFFIYAKDKEDNQTEPINESVVNKLEKLIINKNLSFRLKDFGKFDYRLLMNNPDIKIDDNLIQDYIKINRKYHFKINMEDPEKTNINYISDIIRNELDKYGYMEVEVTDMLIKYLYGIKNSKSKESLWFCYGEIVVDNLKYNIGNKKSICIRCGCRYKKDAPAQKCCYNCQGYQLIKNKTIKCIDCGRQIKVDAKDNKTLRCESCQKSQNNALRMKKYYKLKKQEGLILNHVDGVFLLEPKYLTLINEGYFVGDISNKISSNIKYDTYITMQSSHDLDKKELIMAKRITNHGALDWLFDIKQDDVEVKNNKKIIKMK